MFRVLMILLCAAVLTGCENAATSKPAKAAQYDEPKPLTNAEFAKLQSDLKAKANADQVANAMKLFEDSQKTSVLKLDEISKAEADTAKAIGEINQTIGNTNSEFGEVKSQLRTLTNSVDIFREEWRSWRDADNAPQAPVGPVVDPLKIDAPPADGQRTADASPTLLLFTSDTCPPCKPEEARVASLEAAGEIVSVYRFGPGEVAFDAYNVDVTPTWIRLENGVEVGRVPAAGAMMYRNIDRDSLLRISPPVQAAPRASVPPAQKAVVKQREVIRSGGQTMWYSSPQRQSTYQIPQWFPTNKRVYRWR